MATPICPHCKCHARCVTGNVVYPHRPDLCSINIWVCRNDYCDARVGCHKGSKSPLGTLANAELRAARVEAHAAFDPIWRSKTVTRRQAYVWLADALSIDVDDCHIGLFDKATCERVVQLCTEKEWPC